LPFWRSWRKLCDSVNADIGQIVATTLTGSDADISRFKRVMAMRCARRDGRPAKRRKTA
jgi:hypothetical protein